VQVFCRDGSATPRVQVDYPIGHRKRRTEGTPLLVKKFETSVDAHFGAKQAGERAGGGVGNQWLRRLSGAAVLGVG